MSLFRENDWRDDLSDQLSDLRREVSSLRRDAARTSRSAVSSTRHAGEDVYHAIRDYFSPRRSFYERSWGTARDNPGTTAAAALVGLAVLGLAATFFISNPLSRNDRDDDDTKPTYPDPRQP